MIIVRYSGVLLSLILAFPKSIIYSPIHPARSIEPLFYLYYHTFEKRAVYDMAIPQSQDDHAACKTNLDDLELESVGYKREMPRQFSIWSLGALSFTLTCSWLGTGSSAGIALMEGSYAGTLWSLPIAGVMTTIVSLGMAELASSYPVAGAQYYWAFMVASDDYKPFASYL